MASVLPIQTYENKLNQIDIVDGQIIVCMDTGSLYRDTADKRIRLGSDLKVVQALPIEPLENTFYFLSLTNKLYIYDGEWIQINDSLFVKPDKDKRGVRISLGKLDTDPGITITGHGATYVAAAEDGTISISTDDPDYSLSAISNLEIDEILSM